MVVTLEKSTTIKPREFYGSSLPRPRYFTDPQYNTERVDPPLPVMDPFLSWAKEAHWSMGGLSYKRLRHQGRIEGNVTKLRAQREKLPDKSSPVNRKNSALETHKNNKRAGSVSPPPAPVAIKRRKFIDLNDEDDEGEDEEEGRIGGGFRRGTVRKLKYDFDRVAMESDSDKVGVRTRRSSGGFGVGNDVMNLVEEVNGSSFKSKKVKGNGQSGIRTSPRLAKRK